jgi:hypothetical protein
MLTFKIPNRLGWGLSLEGSGRNTTLLFHSKASLASGGAFYLVAGMTLISLL